MQAVMSSISTCTVRLCKDGAIEIGSAMMVVPVSESNYLFNRMQAYTSSKPHCMYVFELGTSSDPKV